MADSGLFIGFGLPCEAVSARPSRSSTNPSSITPGCSKRVRSKASSRFSLSPTAGSSTGFPAARRQDKLARIRGSEEFERLTARGELIVENLGIVGAFLGERLMSQLSVFSQQVEELS